MTGFYVVVVLHATGHGPLASVAMVTADRAKAVDAMRRVTRGAAAGMAYEFNPDQGASVHLVETETLHDHMPGDPSRPHLAATNDDSFVCCRTLRHDGTWREVGE